MYLANAERELSRARALSAALVMAEKAGWPICRAEPLMPIPFRNYLYVDTAQLLLSPSSEPGRADVEVVDRGMRMARSDAIIVKTSSGEKQIAYCAVGLWRREANEWHHGLRIWASLVGSLWLLPDPADPETRAAFRLTGKRLSAETVTEGARIDPAGFDRADALLAAAWEQR